jgi:hypothetical protein
VDLPTACFPSVASPGSGLAGVLTATVPFECGFHLPKLLFVRQCATGNGEDPLALATAIGRNCRANCRKFDQASWIVHGPSFP